MKFISYIALIGLGSNLAVSTPVNLEIRDAVPTDCSPKHDGTQWGDGAGCTSSKPDGSGTFVSAVDQNHYGAVSHCWTDLYTFDPSDPFYLPYHPVADHDCGTAANCAVTITNGWNNCSSVSTISSTTVGVELGAEFDSFSGAISASHTWSTEWTTQQCNRLDISTSCAWHDKLCHSVWAAEEVSWIPGYVRRRCANTLGSAYTIWSFDVKITVPTGVVATGCAASCSDLTYPGAKLPTQIDRIKR